MVDTTAQSAIVFFDTSTANDNIISPDGKTLYVAGTDGVVRGYDVASHALLTSWAVGTYLGGMDLSPDGSFLIVTDLVSTAKGLDQYNELVPIYTVHRVDTATGAVTNYNCLQPDGHAFPSGQAFFDVAILADHRILLGPAVSTISGLYGMWTLDLSSGAYTSLGLDFGQNSIFTVSDDRRTVLVGEGNSSGGKLAYLHFGDGAPPTVTSTGFGYTTGIQAYNATTHLAAAYDYPSGIRIFDANLNLVTVLTQFRSTPYVGGVTFDANGKNLFVIDGSNHQVVQLSTDTWQAVRTFGIDPNYSPAFNGVGFGDFADNIHLTADGEYLLVNGGNGVERIDLAGQNGTSAADVLTADSYVHHLYGLGGDDTLVSGAGDDLLNGGAGFDTVSYAHAASAVTVSLAVATAQDTGGGGVDMLTGVEGLIGSAFDDTLTGGNGNDLLIGGLGADRLVGGAGIDTISYQESESAVHVDLGLGQGSGGTAEGDTFVGIENIVGSAFADTLVGNGGANLLDGGAGADSLHGGNGDDIYHVDRADDLVFENTGEGTDSVIATAGYYLFANIENLTLAAGAGDIFGVGNELANVIAGNEGSNLLIAGAGDDVVHGGAGVDSLFGQDGNDHLFGDAGVDYLVGGNGDDVIEGGTQADALYGEDGNDILIGGSDFQTDILVGGNGNDILHGDSGLGDYDLMDGGAGDDTYYVDTPADLTFEAVAGGTDTVYANINGAGYYLYANVENLVLLGTTPYGVGNELDNHLTGNAAANYLLGGAGNDILNGKGGNDVLFGEAGADTFVFEHGTGGDVIGDFLAGTDRIDLSAFGFADYQTLVNSMHEVNGTTAIDLGGGDFIVLNGVAEASLHASDFILGSSQRTQIAAIMPVIDTPGIGHGAMIHAFDSPHLDLKWDGAFDAGFAVPVL
jgi:Ca2+-binding RTX toxin-like protein